MPKKFSSKKEYLKWWRAYREVHKDSIRAANREYSRRKNGYYKKRMVIKKIAPKKDKKAYDEILKTQLSKKFIRDKSGNIVRIEKIPYKKPSLRWAL